MKFLGRGSAFNPLQGNTSAYFVKNETLFLMDAGESVFSRIYGTGLLKAYERINIIITHLHADHVGSLPSIISYCYYVLGKKVSVIYPEKALWSLLRLMGIDPKTYNQIRAKEITVGSVSFEAVPVKHADDMNCFGYIIETEYEKIFYSGDSYEIPQDIVNRFTRREIDRIYQDTTEFPSEHLSHCPLEELEKVIPAGLRHNVYCMHFSNDFTAKILEKGFQCVTAEENTEFADSATAPL